MSDEGADRRRGYPDVEKVDDGYYWVTIPITAHAGGENRGPIHDGGTISLYLTEDQLNEWANRFAEAINR